MGKPYSEDLRNRVVAAVVNGGSSCNEAAKQFGVAVSTAIGWVRRQRETGSVAPGKMGGHRPKAISGEHRVWATSDDVEATCSLHETPCLIAATAAGNQLPIRPIVPAGGNKPKLRTLSNPSDPFLLNIIGELHCVT
jgi:hypothetical protein